MYIYICIYYVIIVIYILYTCIFQLSKLELPKRNHEGYVASQIPLQWFTIKKNTVEAPCFPTKAVAKQST